MKSVHFAMLAISTTLFIHAFAWNANISRAEWPLELQVFPTGNQACLTSPPLVTVILQHKFEDFNSPSNIRYMNQEAEVFIPTQAERVLGVPEALLAGLLSAVRAIAITSGAVYILKEVF